jgi:ParB family chromosome partitioning protein
VTARKETGVTEATAVEQEFRLLGLDLIEESKTNPRKTFDAKQLDDLTASVKEKGVIVPILVRPIGGTFEVVAGARRFRAAKKAGLDQIPAIIRQLADDQALEAQVIENLQRADVHPLEEAEGYQALIDKHKYDVEMLATKVGKSVSYIYQRLKLCELIPTAKAGFLGGSITAGHAVLIARLQPKDQVDALKLASTTVEDYVHGFGHGIRAAVSVRALSDWIKNNVHMSLDGAPWKKDDAALLPKAGACTTCPKRAGNAPELFADVARPQTCTDRTCFNEKLKAHMARLAKEVEASGKQVVKITAEYSSDEKGVLGYSQYHKAAGKKRCDDTAVGFYVDGEKRGQTTDVCTNTECRIHRPKQSYSSGFSSSGEDHKEREQRIIKERATERARFLIFSQVIAKTKRLDRKELELVATRFFYDTPYLSGPVDGFREVSTSEISKLSDDDLARFLMGLAIGQELGAQGDAEILYRAASLRKVDVKAIEKDAVRQVAHERLHHAKRLRWKGSSRAQSKTFDELTCKGCGRTEKDQAKGGWHWAKKNDKTKAALCNDCEREENERG